MVSEAEETLEFKDRVVAMNLSDTHLIICSPTQCYVYSLSALNTPIIVDIKEPPVLVQQCEQFFVIVDTLGITVYNHDGRTAQHRSHPFSLPTASSSAHALTAPQVSCLNLRSLLYAPTCSTAASSAFQTTSYVSLTTLIPSAADCKRRCRCRCPYPSFCTIICQRDVVRMYDTATGKLQELVVKHTQEIASISLNSCGGARRFCVTFDV